MEKQMIKAQIRATKGRWETIMELSSLEGPREASWRK